MPADLADRLAPLDDVLDTYADLLVADGVHALVTGRADLANAAMEAAAGLGAPPELRAIRTPRQATTVRVSAWALLLAGVRRPADADPAMVADPAFAAALDAELGAGAIKRPTTRRRSARRASAPCSAAARTSRRLPVAHGRRLRGAGGRGRRQSARAPIATDLEDRLARAAWRWRKRRTTTLARPRSERAGADATINGAAAPWNVDLSPTSPRPIPTASRPTAAERVGAIVVTALADRLTTAASMVPAGGAGPAPPDDVHQRRLRRAIRGVAGRARPAGAADRRRASLLPVLRANA